MRHNPNQTLMTPKPTYVPNESGVAFFLTHDVPDPETYAIEAKALVADLFHSTAVALPSGGALVIFTTAHYPQSIERVNEALQNFLDRHNQTDRPISWLYGEVRNIFPAVSE